MKKTVKKISAITATALMAVTVLAGSVSVASAKTGVATSPAAYTHVTKTAKDFKINAYGKTSYGYNWTYSTTNNVVKVKVNYDFKTHKYTFVLSGIKAGKATMRLDYFTSDNHYNSINLKISVDKNMNVTRLS